MNVTSYNYLSGLRNEVKKSLRSQSLKIEMLRDIGNNPDPFYSRTDISMMIDKYRFTARKYLRLAYSYLCSYSDKSEDKTYAYVHKTDEYIFHAAALLWLCPNELDLLINDYGFCYNITDKLYNNMTALHILLIGYDVCDRDRHILSPRLYSNINTRIQQKSCFDWFMKKYREASVEKEVVLMKTLNGTSSLMLGIINNAHSEIIKDLIALSDESEVRGYQFNNLTLWQTACCFDCDIDVLLILLQIDVVHMLGSFRRL